MMSANDAGNGMKSRLRFLMAGCVIVLLLNSVYVLRKYSANCGGKPAVDFSSSLSWSTTQLKGDPHARAPRSASSSMAACLLIKDDNDIVNEWLAYHYHALALRYLIVAVDPTSETSPTPIFQKWRDLTDMEIIEWGDEDFMPQDDTDYFNRLRISNWTEDVLGLDVNTTMFHNGDEDPETVQKDVKHIRAYIFRQDTFLSSCLREMKKRGRTWTFLLDTDEYIVMNKELRKAEMKPTFMSEIDLAKSASVFDSVMEFVWWSRKRINYPCIPMPSLKYNGVENTGKEEPIPFPVGFDRNSFETLRWTHHIDEKDDERNGPQKTIIDVSQVPDDDQMFSEMVQSVHRPSLATCQDMEDFFDVGRYPFTINHYLGSWERFSGRKSDPRRKSKDRYDYLNDNGNFKGQDTWIGSWVDGFVRAQGLDRASKLLFDHIEGASKAE